MSVINTNIKSLVAQNAGTVNNRAMSKAMEQLSTGKRINSAADDAAGLAISSKMTSQIRGLNQAVRNANDGISMLQTAEGAMIEVTNMLQRMRELAVQSANDTNTSDDRSYLNAEYQALKSEISRVATTTQWNGMNILDASVQSGNFTFQVGANGSSDQQITASFGSMASRSAVAAAVTATTITPSGTNAKQSVVTELDGASLVAGQIVKITVNNKNYEYEITAADLSGTTADNDETNVVTNIVNKLNADTTFTTAGGAHPTISFTASVDSTTKLKIEGNTNNVPFSYSIAVQSAGLSVSGSGGIDNISSLSASTGQITVLDNAIKAVNTKRSDLGAVMNRLTYTVDNLTNVSQNASESRSRILDTDYAAATTELARTQIISQAATAMLAQANQQPQNVLSLLR